MKPWIDISIIAALSILMFGCEQPESQKMDLPQIHLYYDSTDLSHEDKEYIEAHIKWNNQHHQDLARAKFRGGWSQIYPKKSYTINLQSDPQLRALPEDNDWILSASYIDKSMMRHTYSFDLFRVMTGDSMSAPDSYFVEVYVNHHYDGLYLLHPRIDRSFFNLESTGSLFKDPPIFMNDPLPPAEEQGNRFHQKYPKSPQEDHNAQLARIRDKLMGKDLCHGSEVGRYFDMDMIKRWHILLLVTHGSDGLLKNFYLYRRDKTRPFRICIWDYDHSFGREGDNALSTDTSVLDISRNWLLDQLMECPEYRKSLSATYSQLRISGPLNTENMIARLDSLYQPLRPAIYRNGERWPWTADHYHDDNDADAEIRLMKTFIEGQMIELDDYFKNIDPDQ